MGNFEKELSTADDSSDSLDTSSLPSISSGIPQFTHNVRVHLREANCRCTRNGSMMVIPEGLKTDILDILADSMSKITAYPKRDHYESVSKALVEKALCLRK